MSPVRMGVLVGGSLMAAIVSALLVRSIASGHEPHPQVASPAPVVKPMVRVLVAKHDLAPGDKLTPADFSWQPWPQDGLNPAFITDGAAQAPAPAKAPVTVKIETAAMSAATDKARDLMSGGASGASAKLVDAIVRERILANEPIVEQKIVHAGAAGVLAVTLDPGMRAMSVPISAESAAGGFILPGDHVDVVQSRQIDEPGGTKKFASGSVLQNVIVLAVDRITKADKTSSVVGATATLEITPSQADLLALSKSQGELTLILRSYADTAGSPTAGEGPKVAKQTDVAGLLKNLHFVKIYHNGTTTDVMVAR